jgi:hypothetical protein
MHSTNKAFDRYFDIEADDIRSIYQDTAKIVKIDNGKQASVIFYLIVIICI